MEQNGFNKVNESPLRKEEGGEAYTAAGNGDNRESNLLPCATRNHSGECFCGDIRFQISGEPVIQLYCFCEDCHSITGTDGYYYGYMVEESDFHLIRGTPATREVLSKEGRNINHHYCRKCGSNLWAQTDLGLLSISPSTFDNPGVFHHTKKVFVHEAPDWAIAPNEMSQDQDLSSKEIHEDEDTDDFDFEYVDLVAEQAARYQDSCGDEDDTNLELENVDLVLEHEPRYQDQGDNEDDTDLEFENVDLVLESEPRYQHKGANEDDTDLEFENVDRDDRHSHANFSRGQKYSGWALKP
jgi:hypothetical protein